MVDFEIKITSSLREKFEQIKCWSGKTPFQHKFWEVNVLKDDCVVGAWADFTCDQNHGGFSIGIGALFHSVELRIYDHRHWDEATKQWLTPNEK